MSKCDTCKHKADDEGWMFCDRCIHSPGLEDMCKPVTKADHIRAMTNEELADLLSYVFCEDVVSCDICRVEDICLGVGNYGYNSRKMWLNWLQQPYESPTGQKG